MNKPAAYIHEHASYGPSLGFQSLTDDDKAAGWTETPLYTAISSTSQVIAEGWRTIDSAPRDGTKILIAEPVNEEHAMNQHAIYAAWWDEGDAIWTDYAVKSFGYEEVQSYSPTHWMPLPPPPQDRAMIKAAGGGE